MAGYRTLKLLPINGWKAVSARADHFTGKTHEVMQMRRAQRAALHDSGAIDVFRRTMLRTMNAMYNGES